MGPGCGGCKIGAVCGGSECKEGANKMIKKYHYCAMYQKHPGSTEYLHGVMSTNADLCLREEYLRFRELLVADQNIKGVAAEPFYFLQQNS